MKHVQKLARTHFSNKPSRFGSVSSHIAELFSVCSANRRRHSLSKDWGFGFRLDLRILHRADEDGVMWMAAEKQHGSTRCVKGSATELLTS